MDKAIIGGTGVYDIGKESRCARVGTAYGSVEVDIVNIEGKDIVFLQGMERDTIHHPIVSISERIWQH